ncbi:heavy metal-binding domain-containing protein [Spirosoma luteum]|uniref:heavy metal-binding domain-containing protein n=1 Tax=Spirosoma luteum TaxID=431553 RepID=UPI00035F5996|nr:heavy metal-binding domain-containing protein [Spirosoma luteum]
MESQSIKYGSRKGKQTAFKQLLSGVASKSLWVFPVPGLNGLLAKGFNPHQKGVNIATTPKHANVLLVTSPLPEKLTTYAANAYAQMPRPRLLVFVGISSIDPLPSPHFVLSTDEINLLSQKISFSHAWSEEAVAYELPDTDDGKSVYTCPMHPEVQSDQPGNCPKCGMALVKKDDEVKSIDKFGNKGEKQQHEHMYAEVKEDKDIFTCPMHPEIQSDKPGNCPICGMTLVKKHHEEQQAGMTKNEVDGHHLHEHRRGVMNLREPESKQSLNKEVADDKNVYTCPMHPEVQSNEAGQCPKCGMRLVKKEEEKGNELKGEEENKSQHHNQDTQNHHGHPIENDVDTHDMNVDEQKTQDVQGHDKSKHEGHEDMAGMSGREGGFMSMVQMTKDMPRSEDGLAMEMSDVFFGPFHPGLPGGLLVKMKLDGDTVMKATIERDIASQHLLRPFPKLLSQLPQHLSQLNPLLHSTYHLLVYKALSNMGDSNDLVDEVAFLEKDRIGSHLNWLSLFSRTIGDRELHYQASKLCYEYQTGKAAKANILMLTGNAEKTLYLKKRLNNIGIIPEHLLQSVTGPIARAAGMEKDMRQSMPAYQHKNFKPIMLHENNAWGQLQVRLAEIDQSVKLLGDENLNKKIILPEINNSDLPGEQKGEAAVEAPNGKLQLSIEINDGQVKSIAIEAASKVLADVVPQITKAQELSNALVSIASLDISPWEMDA